MTFELPTGMGMFSWKIKHCGNQDDAKYATGKVETVIAECKKAKLTHVIVKCLDGPWSYNQRPTYDAHGNFTGYKDDILKPWVDALHAEDIKVYGYQYVYLQLPEDEGIAAIKRVQEMGLDGLYLDVEKEAWLLAGRETRFTKHLVNAPFPVGLCSFRYPMTQQYNPTFYKNFLAVCHFIAPQVYWEGSHNPAQQLEWSLAEYREGRIYKGKFVEGLKSNLPYLPVGSAYLRSSTWHATVDDLNEFMDCAKENNMQSISWWEWSNVKKYLPENWEAIAAYDYGGNGQEPDLPEDPEEPPVEELELEQRVSILEREARKDNWDLTP